jgi:hypothetical protein
MIRDTSPDDLPRVQKQGHPPDPNPVYVTALAHAWYAEAQANGLDNPKVIPELPYRASDASARCDRDLYYRLTGTEKSNPPTIADQWRFGLGHFVHDGVQKYLPLIAPNARAEIEVDLRPIGIEGSGHCDMATMICRECGPLGLMLPYHSTTITVERTVYACTACNRTTKPLGPGEYDPEVERGENVLELKSINGFAFKMIATTFKSPPEGPRFGHLMQGALAGAVLQADRVCIGYLSLENLSPSMATSFADAEVSRFAAEWWYDMAALTPMVEREQKRIGRLLQFKGVGTLPARELHDPEYPVGAVVIDPKPARGNAPWQVFRGDDVVGMGDTWFCQYCDYRDRCVKDGAS